MHFFLPILLALSLLEPFESDFEAALTHFGNSDWNNAAADLDKAAENPDLFGMNSLPYLRGRIAENQQDWQRSRTEFGKIAHDNPLQALAAWHAARAAIRLGDNDGAMALISTLPLDFPAELKMQLASEAPPELALTIYQGLTTREARLRYALARNDALMLWTLLHEQNADDVGLEAARTLASKNLSPQDSLAVGEAMLTHRQFADAIRFYQTAAQDPSLKAQSNFQIARAHFLSEDYQTALDEFSAIARDFSGSDWQRDAEYQAASCYWRLGDYSAAENAYTDYIAQYGGAARQEGAVRNLVDVYRLLGDNTKALTWLNRGLAVRLTTATRQSLLFTKAKILFAQKRYTPALDIFRQLGRSRLRPAPGGTTKDEVRYYEALSLARLGKTSAAMAIWKQLAAEPLTYYGQKSNERLGRPSVSSLRDVPSAPCTVTDDPVLKKAHSEVEAVRRPIRTEYVPGGNVVDELIFLHAWDEASLFLDRQSRPNPRTAAAVAYLAGRYHRAIAYADRMPKSDAYTQRLLHPAGFNSLICEMAAANQIDPLWLNAIIWQESRYNPLSRSGASARGLMQFIPETASAVAASMDLPAVSVERLYDPRVSIQLGARYWALLMSEFKRPELALAAYNGGPDNVRRWKGKWPDGDTEFFVADIGFIETKNYVLAVFGAYASYASR